MRENKGQHYTIAIMAGHIQSDYSKEMLRGFYTAAQEENVNIVLLVGPQVPTSCTDIMVSSLTGNFQYQFSSIYEYTNLIKPDALLVVYGALSAPYPEQGKQVFFDHFKDIPCLMIEDQSHSENIPSVITDSYTGMRACIKHLIVDHGYQKIAFLSGPKGNYDAEERLRAYRETMKEFKLTVTDGMVAYGDYTDNVDEQIMYLFAHTPGLQAIACADDIMAQACYRVCNMRGLLVGRDIAITGFDDTTTASIMNPPLTSVSQSNFEVCYKAMKNAVAMCRGEKVVSDTMPTELRRRCSCGCSPARALNVRYIPKEELRDFIEAALGEMIPYLFASISYSKDREYLSGLLTKFCFYINDTIMQGDIENFDMEHLMELLQGMVEYPYFSSEPLLESLVQFLQIMLVNVQNTPEEKLIATIIAATQHRVHSHNIEKLETEVYQSIRQSWFVPMFARDLAGEAYLNNPQEIFYRVMTELKKMSVKSTYFFLFDKKIPYMPGRWLDFPEKMGLLAYFDENDMKFYHDEERPRFSEKEGMMSFIDGRNPVNMVSLVLFSEHSQYGIMMCEVDPEDVAFLQICSVQIGTVLHFIELHQKEQQAQEQLKNSLKVIKEQNSILSFLSEYDELTKLLNRRGFIERVLALYERSGGRKAYLIFGDLDHLKEINDKFGHAEGDVAITSIADRFSTILPPSAVIGRIGGDEFVAFVLTDEADFGTRIKREFTEESNRFNAESDKPYYIESSVGVYEFVCDPTQDFDDMLRKSDELLYQAKALRRKTIQKFIEDIQ